MAGVNNVPGPCRPIGFSLPIAMRAFGRKKGSPNPRSLLISTVYLFALGKAKEKTRLI